MFFKKIAAVLVLMSISISAAASGGYNTATHDVYTNGTNFWLKAKPLIVLIASDVNIPLTLDPLYEDVLLTSIGSGGWSVTYSPSTPAGSWSKASNKVYSSDYDGDGSQDLFIRAKNSSQQSLIVYSEGGTNPTLLAVSATQGGIDHSTSSGFSISFNGSSITATKSGHVTMVASIGSSGVSTFSSKNNNYELADEPASSVETLYPVDYVGAESYTASVGQDGSVSANFPIELPSGISGLTPKLSVVYNSNAGNGLLGIGFNLASTSSIRRCGKTISTDGVASAVTFSDSDALCFGGSKLIAVNGSSSFTDDSEYRTELDGYNKIVLSRDGSKFSFSVYAKDGKEYTYGKAIKSRGINSGVEKEWLLTQIKDRFNNTIEYGYLDGSYGDSYLSEIKYSDMTVALNYTDHVRNDSVIKFANGDEYRISKYLETITVSSTATFREYHYYYDLDGNGKYNSFNEALQLKALQECGYKVAGDTTTKSCKPALTLDWNDLEFDLVDDGNSQVATLGSRRQTLAVDWDQSGTDDVIVLGEDRISIHYSNSNGQLQSAQTLYSFPSGKMISSIIPVDLNLDGEPELVFRSYNDVTGATDNNLQWHLMQHGGSLQSLGGVITSENSNKYPVVADINGDAYPDLILPLGSSQWKIAYNNSSTIGSASLSAPGNAISGTGEATKGLTLLGRVGDSNYFLNEKDSGLDLLKISASGSVNTYVTGIVNEKYIPLDANGDGLKDLLVGSSGNLLLYLNNGFGFDKVVTTIASSVILDSYADGLTYRNYPTKVHDFNQDGMDDLSYVESNQIKFLLSTGADFNQEIFDGINFSGISGGTSYEALKNAIGLPEICFEEIEYLGSIDDLGFTYVPTSSSLSDWLDNSKEASYFVDGVDAVTSNIYEASVVLGTTSDFYRDTIYNSNHPLHLDFSKIFVLDSNGSVQYDENGSVITTGYNYTDAEAKHFSTVSDQQRINLGSNTVIYYRVMKSVISALTECQNLVEGTPDQFSVSEKARLNEINTEITAVQSYLTIYLRPFWRSLKSSRELTDEEKGRRLISSGGLTGVVVNDFSHYFLGNVIWGLDSVAIGDASNNVYMDIFSYQFADVNADGSLELVKQLVQGSNQWIVSKNQSQGRAQLNSITDAKGKTTSFDYSNASDSAIYTASENSVEGELVIHGGYPLVSSITIEDSSSASNIREQKTFKYENIRLDLFGRGLLGSEKYTVNDAILNTSVMTEYYQDFPRIGREKTVTSEVTGITLSESSTAWLASTSAPYQVTLDTVTRTDYEQSPNTAYVETETDYTFDNYGNMTGQTSTVSDLLNANAEVSEYTYSATYPFESGYNSIADWTISFAKTQTETWSRTSNASNLDIRSVTDRSLTKAYTQYLDTLRPSSEVVSTPSGDLTTTYDYDLFGNITSVSSNSAEDGLLTVTYSDFENDKWPKTITNSHFGATVTTTRTYDGRYGGVKSTNDYAGIVTSTEFDAFGRISSQADALNNETTIQYGWCVAGISDCAVDVSGTLASYFVTTNTPGAPEVTEYYDTFSNKVKVKQAGFSNSEYIYQQWGYDTAGRLTEESIPAFTFPVTTVSTTTYDDFGRVDLITRADGGSIDYTYGIDGANRKTTQSVTIASSASGVSNRTSVREDYFSADGLVVKSIQALGDTVDQVTTLYDYDPQQNLDWTQVQGPDASVTTDDIVVTQKFDVVGNRLYMNDPDVGVITDTYSPRGNLLSSTNNANQLVSYTYDALDRKKTRTELEGTTTWYYDKASECSLDDTADELHSLNGYLCAASAPNQNYKAQYAYDIFGQQRAVRQELTGYEFGSTGKNWLVAYNYDTYGRDSGTIYDSEVEIVRDYTSTGYLDLVKNYAAPTTQYYDVTAINAYGGVREFSLGNGVDVTHTVDETSGRLTRITATNDSNVTLVDETYGWFSDGALYSKDHTRPGDTVNETYSYDAMSRLDTVTRNGVTEQYDYNVLGNMIAKPGIAGAYSYAGTGNAGPHAVTQAGGVSYGYDVRGNMTQRGSDNIAYTSYDKPYSISSSTGTETFTYGPDRSRFRHASGSTTTYYQTGSPYEEIFTTGNADSVKRHYIDGGLVLDLEGTTETYKYQIKDYKDSLLVVTDETGNALQYATFDAYGERTEGDNSIVTRGFTDHEHLDSGLIHMNGRVYDPVVGRFLSPDVLVQAPFNSQSYNRYSYVWNNPVSFVDPSGYLVQEGAEYTGDFLEYLGLDLPQSNFLNNDVFQGFFEYKPTTYSDSSYLGNEVNALIGGAANIIKVGMHSIGSVLESTANSAQDDISGVYDGSVSLISFLTGESVSEVDRQLGNAMYATSGFLPAARWTSYGRAAPSFVTKRLAVPDNLPKNIHPGQQGKHIPGHNNYTPGRSPLAEGVNPQTLLDGVQNGAHPIVRMTPRGQPVVDFGKAIGQFEGKATNFGIIHHGKKGAHIVPANPVQF